MKQMVFVTPAIPQISLEQLPHGLVGWPLDWFPAWLWFLEQAGAGVTLPTIHSCVASGFSGLCCQVLSWAHLWLLDGFFGKINGFLYCCLQLGPRCLQSHSILAAAALPMRPSPWTDALLGPAQGSRTAYSTSAFCLLLPGR